MVMGGVPFYLMQARKGLSSAQIIDIVCFAREGLLRNEFDYLYASLFDHSDQHLKIVNTMRKKRGGMTRNEILESSGIPTGGTATLLLEELEESGFIASSIPLGKKANDALYRISDEFTLFYLDWIKPLGKLDPGQGYWLSMQNDPKRRAWTGYAWEELCLKHIVQIKKALGISNVITFNSPWRYIPKESGQKGVQIDLLIDRKDATMNLCEMKFSESEFAISADYVKQLRQKKEVIRNVTKTNKNIFITFITTFGVLQNAAALEIADQFIKMDQLFTDD